MSNRYSLFKSVKDKSLAVSGLIAFFTCSLTCSSCCGDKLRRLNELREMKYFDLAIPSLSDTDFVFTISSKSKTSANLLIT